MEDESIGVNSSNPPATSPCAVSLTGELVTKTFDFDGGRLVSVYVPVGSANAIVFTGDGQGILKWAKTLESSDFVPTMIVGVHGLVNEMRRLEEYSPVFNAARFVTGYGLASASRHLPNAPPYLGYRREENSRSRSGIDTPIFTASFSLVHQVRVTNRPVSCHERFRARTSSPARGNHSFSTTPHDGPTLCVTQEPTWS